MERGPMERPSNRLGDLADLTAGGEMRTGAVAAHRKLNEMERQGVITLRAGRITARDPQLQRKAEELLRRVQEYGDVSGEDPGYEWD